MRWFAVNRSNLFTLPLLSLTLTFNFSVDRFISLSFGRSGCIGSKRLRSVVIHFRVFPHFTFVIV